MDKAHTVLELLSDSLSGQLATVKDMLPGITPHSLTTKLTNWVATHLITDTKTDYVYMQPNQPTQGTLVI